MVIDPVLKQYKIPLKMRDVGNLKEKRERGSTISVEPCDTIRPFVYWHESTDSGRVDLDLSVMLYDEDLGKSIETCSYYDMSSRGRAMTHSGDIQSAPYGASEMVDIDVEHALKKGARYALVYVNAYTGTSFETFEAFAGIQSGENLGGQSKFNALDVEMRFNLTGSAASSISYMYDLKEHVIIYGNMSADSFAYDNIGTTKRSNKSIGNFLLNASKCNMSMYEYFKRFAKVNGATVVDEVSEDVAYDHVFDYSTTQNIDEFNTKWLL